MITKAELVQQAQFRYAVRQFLRFAESTAREAGVTPQQYQMMLAIRGNPDRDWATPGEIADSLQINHNAAVGLVNRGEAAGLVVRSVHLEDRRRVCVALTEKGESILTRVATQNRQELARHSLALRALFPQ